MTKEEFKVLYNNFKISWSTAGFAEFDQKWGTYKSKILSDKGLPLAAGDPDISWTKFNENDTEYLLRFIEWEHLFGKAKGGSSKQYMIYHNFGEHKGQYYDGYKDKRYYIDEGDVLDNYKGIICKLLQQIVNSKTINDLKQIEKDIKKEGKKRFDAKQIIRKLTVLHFALDDINSGKENNDATEKLNNNSLLWIYKDETVDNLYELFVGDNGNEKSFFEKSNAVWTKAVEWLKETEVNDWKNGCPSTITTDNYKQFAKLNNLLWELGKNNAGELTNFDVPNVIYHGAPGTGKTYTTLQTVKLLCQGDNSRYKYCQFHPSYSYQDFIEGIKPMRIVGGNVNLEVVNGIFKQFCIDVKDKNETFYEGFKKNNKGNAPKIDDYPHYYFIVDEINRGDLSRIFGETFSLLEPDYRDKDFSKPNDGYKKSENLIVTPLSNVIEKTSNKEGLAYKIIDGKVYFGIPFNIHFIGLMNDVDKSIDTFDLALRRRFKWITKKCDYDVIQDSLLDKITNTDEVADYKKSCETLNKFITKPEGLGLSENYQLGQSYFMKIVNMLSSKSKTITETARKSVFENYIETTLREYAREVCDENEIDDKINGAKKEFGIDIEKTTNSDEE